MKFATLSLDDAGGAILAHGLRLKTRRLAKGHLLTPSDIASLRAAGFVDVMAARLDGDDIGENEAAMRAAHAIAGPYIEAASPFTGRCNLYSTAHGLLQVDRAKIDHLNAIDEAITLATVTPDEPVTVGQLVATVKVIPLAISQRSIDTWVAAVAATNPPVSVAPFENHGIGLLLTHLPGTKSTVLDKTRRTMESRVIALGSHLAEERRCAHTIDAIAKALGELKAAACDPIVILGASAIVDRRDVVPAAIERGGGEIVRLGMPVDPGNLMLLASHGAVSILGLPGSARSPRISGFDFILWRLLAKRGVGAADLAAMGVGGLLKDIPNRPYPREARAISEQATDSHPHIAAIVLAAGQSRRMGTINKLLAEIDGAPMVQRVVDAIAASRVTSTIVVTGHQAADVRAALAQRPLVFVDNPSFDEGLSSSLGVGINALADDIDGVLICLGDMPRIKPHHLNRLIDSFDPTEGRGICVPTARGKRGNPVLFGREFFDDLRRLAGDVGARHLIGKYGDLVHEVDIGDDSIFIDVDTPRALAELSIAKPDHAV